MGKLGLLASIKESFNDDDNDNHKNQENFIHSLTNSFDSSEEDENSKNFKKGSTQTTAFDISKYIKIELENLLKVDEVNKCL